MTFFWILDIFIFYRKKYKIKKIYKPISEKKFINIKLKNRKNKNIKKYKLFLKKSKSKSKFKI